MSNRIEHDRVFGRSVVDRWSGYVSPAKNNSWRIRVVITNVETGKRRTLNSTVRCAREAAEGLLQAALQRGREGYDLELHESDTILDLTPKLRAKAGSTGAMSEILVCLALLKRGYDVYRSVAVSGACDLIALNHTIGVACRIEVKTSHRKVSGDLRFTLKDCQRENHDVLALVTLIDSTVEFRPNIEAWFQGSKEAECVPNAC